MQIDALAILIINAVAGILALAICRIFPSTPRRAFLGYYLVLMPAGFAVWENPEYWVQAAFAIIGLVWITFAMARAGKGSAQAAHD